MSRHFVGPSMQRTHFICAIVYPLKMCPRNNNNNNNKSVRNPTNQLPNARIKCCCIRIPLVRKLIEKLKKSKIVSMNLRDRYAVHLIAIYFVSRSGMIYKNQRMEIIEHMQMNVQRMQMNAKTFPNRISICHFVFCIMRPTAPTHQNET